MKFDNQLIECLNRYSSPIQPLGDNLKEVIKRSEAIKENLIPVLGMQGMGKSTLINGLLKADILPNDADETTCVPVEVTYGEDEHGEVYFIDKGKSPVVVHTREDLNRYVDNNENPANSAGVERIRLYRKADILRSGVTIVDLPGVGSVTLENERTTQRYIQNVATAIFVIPTVPTIRRMEEIFIQGAWSQFSNAMFVQNEWNDTKEEIRDSVDHNTKILNQLAEKIGSKFNGPIIVVNAFDAVEGALSNDKRLIDKSNIAALAAKITTVASNWETHQRESMWERVILIVETALANAKKKLEDAQKSEEERLKVSKIKYEKAKSVIEDILKKISEIESWLDSQESSIRKELNQNLSVTIGDIRAEIYKKIDDGIVDGERLEKAFNDVQSSNVQDFFDKVIERLNEFAIELQSKMMELEGKLTELQNDINYDPVTHKTDEAFKYEKVFGVGGGIVGGVVGAVCAAPVAAFIISNPVGWVVGAVGLVIAGVITGIASLFKKGIKAKRQREAKEKIEKPLSQVEEKLEKSMRTKVCDMFKECRQLLSSIAEAQEDELRILRREARRVEKNVDIATIETDISYLTLVKKNIFNEK